MAQSSPTSPSLSRLERWRRDGGPRLSRVAIAVAVVTALVLAAGAVLVVRSTSAYHRSQTTITARLDPAIDAADTLFTAFLDEETATRGYLIGDRTSFLQPFTDAQPTIAQRLATLQRLTAGHPDEQGALQAVIGAHDLWRSSAADPELADMQAGNVAAARALEASGVGKSAFDALRAEVDQLSTSLRAKRDSAEDTFRHDQSVALLVGTLMLVLIALLVVAFYVLLWRGVLRPLRSLALAAEAVSTTDLDTSLPAAGPPEIRGVGRSVERMRLELLRQLRTAREAREALSTRGQAVIALQAELTPRLDPVPGLAVAAKLQPAEGLLAGDWYDQVLLHDGRVAVVLGDVSGHGAAAGAYALGLSRSLRSALAAGMSPSQALGHVGGLLDDDLDDERFASVFVAVIDIGAGTGTYASAGHPDAMLFAADGSVQALPPTGPLLAAIIAGPHVWRTAPFSMPSESLLLAVTDGLLEARDASGVEYGPDRLVREVLGLTSQGSHWSASSPEDLLDQLFARVEAYTRGLAADDRTALAVVRHARTLAPDLSPSRLR